VLFSRTISLDYVNLSRPDSPLLHNPLDCMEAVSGLRFLARSCAPALSPPTNTILLQCCCHHLRSAARKVRPPHCHPNLMDLEARDPGWWQPRQQEGALLTLLAVDLEEESNSGVMGGERRRRQLPQIWPPERCHTLFGSPPVPYPAATPLPLR
jgi:hypothetical protein